MERIQNILQKLQELYEDKHQKSDLDLDLMLDYTRVLYADLLEWRNNVPQSSLQVSHKLSTEDKAAIEAQENVPFRKAESAEMPLQTEANKEEKDPVAIQPQEEIISDQEIKTGKQEETSTETENKTFNENQEKEPSPIPEQEKESEKEVPLIQKAKQEIDSLLTHERPAISFEPPHLVEEAPKEIEHILEEEAPAKPYNIITEKKTEAVPDFSHLFEYKNQKSKKDIRNEIGLNDRYLYLNELFNNQKSIYEAVLTKLNDMNNLAEANEYIKKEVAETHNWDEEEETVQDFYALLQKHFSTK